MRLQNATTASEPRQYYISVRTANSTLRNETAISGQEVNTGSLGTWTTTCFSYRSKRCVYNYRVKLPFTNYLSLS